MVSGSCCRLESSLVDVNCVRFFVYFLESAHHNHSRSSRLMDGVDNKRPSCLFVCL